MWVSGEDICLCCCCGCCVVTLLFRCSVTTLDLLLSLMLCAYALSFHEGWNGDPGEEIYHYHEGSETTWENGAAVNTLAFFASSLLHFLLAFGFSAYNTFSPNPKRRILFKIIQLLISSWKRCFQSGLTSLIDSNGSCHPPCSCLIQSEILHE